jgi:hypothetical protein
VAGVIFAVRFADKIDSLGHCLRIGRVQGAETLDHGFADSFDVPRAHVVFGHRCS